MDQIQEQVQLGQAIKQVSFLMGQIAMVTLGVIIKDSLKK